MGQIVTAVLGPVLGGADSGRRPAILPEDRYVTGVNLVIREGFARTRPAFVEQEISGMPTGTFQGAGVWSLNGGDRIVFVASGSVYVLDVDTLALTAISGAALHASDQVFSVQADRYFILQDGTSDPVILTDDAGTPRRFVYASDASYGDAANDGYDAGTDASFGASQQLPVGTVMHYASGRLHVVPRYVPGTTKTGKPYFLSGDIVKPSRPEDCLRFSETQYLNGGGAHGIPLEMGYIGGMATLRSSQQGTSVGDLLAFGVNGLSAFAVSVPRDTWDDTVLYQGLFVGAGTKSPWSVIQSNNEIMFRGLDGLRSVAYTTSQHWQQGALYNNPMSTEVAQYMDDASYLPWVSSAFSDNNYLTTVEGAGDRYFKGLLHMDVAPTVNLSSPTAGPAYSGVWTGLNFAQVLRARASDVPTLFVFAEGPVLYRVDSDADADTGPSPIESRLITRAYHFGNFSLRKKLKWVDLWVSELSRDTDISVYARPYGYPFWALVSSKAVKVGDSSAAQVRHRLRFGLDSSIDTCDASTGRPLYNAPEFQFAIQWTGHMQLDRAVFFAEEVGEEPPDPCSEEDSVVLSAGPTSGVVLNDFSYSIGS